MKRLFISLILFVVFAGGTVSVTLSARAASVALFSNDAFVDTTGAGDGYPGEVETVRASLTSMGHTVVTFSGFTAADFNRAAAQANLIVFPDFERGALDAALDPSAVAALRTYVASGGGVVVMGTPNTYDVDLLNKVFEFSLVDAWLALSTFGLHDLAAANTPFATGPADLVYHSDTSAVSAESLPAGSLNLYSGIDVQTGTEDVVVFVANAGKGKVGYLGWDWFYARPLGLEDGGWMVVLDRMLLMTAGPFYSDTDDDGVPDAIDQCSNTPANVVVNEHGCSIDQLVPCAGPSDGGEWKSHGQYLKALRSVADSFYSAGLIDANQRDDVMRRGTASRCGRNF